MHIHHVSCKKYLHVVWLRLQGCLNWPTMQFSMLQGEDNVDAVSFCCIALLQELKEQVNEVGQQIAMHAAGMRPLFLARSAVPEELLEYERNTLRQQVSTLM